VAAARIWLFVALAGCRAPANASREPGEAPRDGDAAMDRDAPRGPDGDPNRDPNRDLDRDLDRDSDRDPDRVRDTEHAPDQSPPREPVQPRSDARGEVAPAQTPAGPFTRGSWASWEDADGDCQDTRTEVLVATSEIPVVFADERSCTVATGRWRCPYTDRTTTDPRTLDIDHLVPLAHAHEAGAARWDVQRLRSYANALDDPDHLVAVDRSANRSKGARTVTQWLPEEPGFRCQYVAAWRRIKKAWRLAEADAERTAIDDMLRICAAGDVPERPGKPKAKTTPATSRGLGGACCRVCKSGQPCGDACIAADKVCRKPPGCAC
jgi:hypothetical protein